MHAYFFQTVIIQVKSTLQKYYLESGYDGSTEIRKSIVVND